uniref:RRM domain-containing protein n=1 Tax=Takifugu rubripes TaxID=31033 RepID=A0A674PPP4_TAKRU
LSPHQLYNIFSCFGPLYLLKVCSNAPQNPPGFYALVKFYSAAQASKAQCHTDGQALFQTSPLKVRLGSRKTPHCHLTVKRRSLSHSHCVELANYFCGFNGWRTKIISLKELTDEHEAEGGVRFRRLKFGCELEKPGEKRGCACVPSVCLGGVTSLVRGRSPCFPWAGRSACIRRVGVPLGVSWGLS